MLSKNCYIGFDTSNYTTSLAAVDSEFNVLFDQRKLLKVKEGEVGLRQSEALFQHMENIPDMLENLYSVIDKAQIQAIAVSDKPRPCEGSYMPVFNAGRNYGKVISGTLGIPVYAFSHQEGHLESAVRNSGLKQMQSFVALHLSGGTSEVLRVTNKDYGYSIAVIGGSRDISFGQLIDRVGVSLSLDFPCGAAMDLMAIGYTGESKKLLKPIYIEGLDLNLSGIETQCQRMISSGCDQITLVYELFDKISASLCSITEKSAGNKQWESILFMGGVSASSFIRTCITDYFQGTSIKVIFGDPQYATDNAVGIATLGAKAFNQSRI